MHPFQRAHAQRRIAGMARPALETDRFHQDALVHPHRLQPGRLADQRMPSQRLARRRQRPRAVHAALFIRRGQNHQRLAQIARREFPRRFDRQRQKRLHIGGTQPVNPPVRDHATERIEAPATGVERHGIGMPGQHQPARSTAQRGDQVGLVRPLRQRLDPHREAGVLQPAGQQVDDRPVALVELRRHAAHRRGGDQLTNAVQQQG